jgi:hypothetical protein
MRADNQEFERSKLTVVKKLVHVFRQKVNSTQTRGATQAPGDTDATGATEEAPDATHAQCASTSLAALLAFQNFLIDVRAYQFRFFSTMKPSSRRNIQSLTCSLPIVDNGEMFLWMYQVLPSNVLSRLKAD